MSLVTVRDFSYTYPNATRPALEGINLSVEQGEFVVVAGPSGGGKSTLGKALAGFLFQDEQPNYAGEIIVHGTAMDQVPLYEASERVAYVQQNPEDQFCTLTVLDEIAFGLENRCVAPDMIAEQIEKALAIVQGLELKNRSLDTLSGGEKQKVAIASMLVLNPDVLILDEPTSNLDPAATLNVFSALHHMRTEQNLTVIIIEHKLNQLISFEPRWVILEDGKIAQEGMSYYQSQIHKAASKHFPVQFEPHADKACPLYRLENVSLKAGQKTILEDTTLDLYAGEFISLMGPNGSGKTSLLQLMMKLLPVNSGQIFAFGQDLANTRTSTLVEKVGFLFQNPDHQLFTQSVWEEATLTLENLHQLTPEKIEEAESWLSRLELSDRLQTHPNRLSYGEKRRLNLVSALLHGPALLILDEFLIGQDSVNAHQWMHFLSDFTNLGNTVLLVNHHPELSQIYCDRILFLNEGKLQIDSPAVEAFAKIADLGFSAFLPQYEGESDYA